MKSFKIIASLIVCFSLAACSSTKQMSYSSNMIDHITNNMASHVANKVTNKRGNVIENGYYTNHFKRTQFVPVAEYSVKKQAKSDHQLMMSLLNRPMTADQAMMLSFAQERESYSTSFASHGYGIRIMGAKSSSDNDNRSQHIYANVIAQDINAVVIAAPQ